MSRPLLVAFVAFIALASIQLSDSTNTWGGRLSGAMLTSKASSLHKALQSMDEALHLGATFKPKAKYLAISAGGGLNQQRLQICDAVALASLFKMKMVIPRLSMHQWWKDKSEFGDVFNVTHFLATLSPFIDIEDVHTRNKYCTIALKGFTSYQDMQNYLKSKAQKCDYMHIRSLTRLPRLPLAGQFIQYYCNFASLKYVDVINEYSARYLQKLGPNFTVLHPRIEDDMLAITGCREGKYYADLAKRLWPKKHAAHSEPKHCPPTTQETVECLTVSQIPRETVLYVAGQGITENFMKDLQLIFPFAVTKESLEFPTSLGPTSASAIDVSLAVKASAYFGWKGNFETFVNGHRFVFAAGKTYQIKPCRGVKYEYCSTGNFFSVYRNPPHFLERFWTFSSSSKKTIRFATTRRTVPLLDEDERCVHCIYSLTLPSLHLSCISLDNSTKEEVLHQHTPEDGQSLVVQCGNMFAQLEEAFLAHPPIPNSPTTLLVYGAELKSGRLALVHIVWSNFISKFDKVLFVSSKEEEETHNNEIIVALNALYNLL